MFNDPPPPRRREETLCNGLKCSSPSPQQRVPSSFSCRYLSPSAEGVSMAREPVWFRCCSVHFTAIIRSHSRRSSPELRGRTQQTFYLSCYHKLIFHNVFGRNRS